MKPVEFVGQNVIYAKDQPEYLPLPAHKTKDGTVTSCWAFTFKERLRILFGANVYWSQMTFNSPLQPIYPSLDFKAEGEGETKQTNPPFEAGV